MGLDELSRDQIVQLKQSMLEEVLGEEPSWYDLAMADDIVSDEKLEEEYGGTHFCGGRFLLVRQDTNVKFRVKMPQLFHIISII